MLGRFPLMVFVVTIVFMVCAFGNVSADDDNVDDQNSLVPNSDIKGQDSQSDTTPEYGHQGEDATERTTTTEVPPQNPQISDAPKVIQSGPEIQTQQPETTAATPATAAILADLVGDTTPGVIITINITTPTVSTTKNFTLANVKANNGNSTPPSSTTTYKPQAAAVQVMAGISSASAISASAALFCITVIAANCAVRTGML